MKRLPEDKARAHAVVARHGRIAHHNIDTIDYAIMMQAAEKHSRAGEVSRLQTIHELEIHATPKMMPPQKEQNNAERGSNNTNMCKRWMWGGTGRLARRARLSGGRGWG